MQGTDQPLVLVVPAAAVQEQPDRRLAAQREPLTRGAAVAGLSFLILPSGLAVQAAAAR